MAISRNVSHNLSTSTKPWLRTTSVSDLQGLTLRPALSLFELLPQKIRHSIYKYLLSSRYTVVYHDKDERLGQHSPRSEKYKGYSFALEVFRVNRSVCVESMEFFYSENKFVTIHSNAPRWITMATIFLPILSRNSSDGSLPYSLSVELTVDEDPQMRVLLPGQLQKHNKAAEVSTIMAAQDLPVFVRRLRTSLLRVPSHTQVTISLEMRDAPRGKEVYATAFLEPFHHLVRVSTVNLSGNVDAELADLLRSKMLARPPIGEELLAELRAIRKRAQRLVQSNNLLAAKQAFHEGRQLLYLAGGDPFLRAGLKRIGGPVIFADVLVESLGYDVQLLSLLFRQHASVDDFEEAMEIESRVTSTIGDLLPQYGSQRKAKLYFELGDMYRRLANFRAAFKEEGKDIAEGLRKAQAYYERSMKLVPGNDAKYASYLAMIQEKWKQLGDAVL